MSVTHCRFPRWTWAESRTPFCEKVAPLACTPADSSAGGCSSRRSDAGSGSLLPATTVRMFRDPECRNIPLYRVPSQAKDAKYFPICENWYDTLSISPSCPLSWLHRKSLALPGPPGICRDGGDMRRSLLQCGPSQLYSGWPPRDCHPHWATGPGLHKTV